MEKPDFLTTKGERRLRSSVINVEHLEQHYRDIIRGIFEWDGLPDDMPEGFIDADALWYNSGFAMKDVKRLGMCGFPAEPVTLDIYGRPSEWIAKPYGWPADGGRPTGSSVDAEIFGRSDTPVLWVQESFRTRCLPYLQIMARALQALGNNITALNHPILLSGVASGQVGDNIASILLKTEIEEGSTFIPIVRPDLTGLEAIDLGVADNTQNLASIIDWCDSKILEIIGVSTGVEKSSGITTMETASGLGGMGCMSDSALAVRQAWAEKANAVLGTTIKVKRAGIIEDIVDGDENDADVDDSKNMVDEPEGFNSIAARDARQPGHRWGRLRFRQRGHKGYHRAGTEDEMTDDECPYGAEDCPKLADLKHEVDAIEESMNSMARTLYLIAGILLIDLGVMLT